MSKNIYNSHGYADDCHFLEYLPRSKKYQCQALVSLYNDKSLDPDDWDCFGCPFFKTDSQLKEERLKTKERLKNLKRGMFQ